MVIEKLWQIGVIEAESGIEWALRSIKSQPAESKLSEDALEYKIIKLLFERIMDKSTFLVTLY